MCSHIGICRFVLARGHICPGTGPLGIFGMGRWCATVPHSNGWFGSVCWPGRSGLGGFEHTKAIVVLEYGFGGLGVVGNPESAPQSAFGRANVPTLPGADGCTGQGGCNGRRRARISSGGPERSSSSSRERRKDKHTDNTDKKDKTDNQGKADTNSSLQHFVFELSRPLWRRRSDSRPRGG